MHTAKQSADHQTHFAHRPSDSHIANNQYQYKKPAYSKMRYGRFKVTNSCKSRTFAEILPAAL